jgi:hypothetical protein
MHGGLAFENTFPRGRSGGSMPAKNPEHNPEPSDRPRRKATGAKRNVKPSGSPGSEGLLGIERSAWMRGLS